MRKLAASHIGILAVAAGVLVLAALPSAQGAITQWNRGAATDDWNTIGNWTARVPTAPDQADFLALGAGDVDIGGSTYTITTLNFGAGDHVLKDGGGPPGSPTLTTVTNSAGTNDIDLVLDSGGVVGAVSGARLNLNNDGNGVAGGTWTVSGGARSAAWAGRSAGPTSRWAAARSPWAAWSPTRTRSTSASSRTAATG